MSSISPLTAGSSLPGDLRRGLELAAMSTDFGAHTPSSSSPLPGWTRAPRDQPVVLNEMFAGPPVA